MKVIYFAVAMSIAAHLLLGPLVHVKFVDAAPEQKPDRIRIVQVTPPKPVPTKPPLPQRPVAPAHPSKPNQPRAPVIHSANNPNVTAVEPGQDPNDVGQSGQDIGPGTGPGVASAAPTEAPTPSPTPKPVCSAPYVEASTVEKYTPEIPQMAREQGLSGVAQVQVDLSASGQVLSAKIFASTGSSLLDNAAVDAARRTTYSPKIVDCGRVPGSYLYRVEFQDN